MPIIYWCCSRGKVHPHVQRLQLHSQVWLLSDSDCITVEWRIMCQVSDVFRQLKFAFVSNVRIPSCRIWECLVFRLLSWFREPSGTFPTWHSAVILVPAVLYSSQQHAHCKSDSNDSLGSLGNQVLRDQERSISHFSSETKRWLDKGKVGGRAD